MIKNVLKKRRECGRLPLQLMKAAVPAESYTLFIFLHRHLESPTMSTGSSQVGAALSPSFKIRS